MHPTRNKPERVRVVGGFNLLRWRVMPGVGLLRMITCESDTPHTRTPGHSDGNRLRRGYPNRTPLDFAAIDSKEKAQGLYREGRLHKVHLVPMEAGGHDAEVNVVYLPEEAAREKSSIDAQIIALAEAGRVYRYRARPVYRGRSVISARIDVEASGAEALTKQIEVW